MNKFVSLFYWIFAILLIPLTSKDNLKQGQDLANIISNHKIPITTDFGGKKLRKQHALHTSANLKNLIPVNINNDPLFNIKRW